MLLTDVVQLLVFIALLLNTVHLMPSLGRAVRGRIRTLQPGFHFAILGTRLFRNLTGLLLVPATAAPSAGVQALVPVGIATFVAFAIVNAWLTHRQQQCFEAWAEDQCRSE